MKKIQRDQRKNEVLRRAILEVYPSVAAFCRENGFTQSPVGNLINLKDSPYGKKGKWRPLAIRLADAVGITCKELFPLALYGLTNTHRLPVCLMSQMKEADLVQVGNVPSLDGFLEVVFQRDLEEKIQEFLADRLNEREQLVLNHRFGMAGHEQLTLKELGALISRDPEITRQIQQKALMKLRRWTYRYGFFIEDLRQDYFSE